ncbi:MAG: hypothetical protein NC489_31440 [Ruminococcus flavefaciens]|nr:hypothetical protein [Ruminococcus flavefaciens]
MFGKKIRSSINKHIMDDIDILVLGNRGSGKTSLLSTTLYNMNELMQSNGIVFEASDEETFRRLENSISEIKNMFTSNGIVEVGEGIAGTDGFIDYNFRLTFTDKSWNMASGFNIKFHDYAGSILSNGDKDKQYEVLKEWFVKSQIIYILIDAPYLMEATRKTITEYSAKNEILALFQKAGVDSADKMIAIVPTKCEYYLRNSRALDITNHIRTEFKEIISCIGQLNKAEGREKYKLYITPVQTVGGLEFSKMESRDGRQVALFRRTKPNSQFKPINTDLLLLFCMNYLFNSFFKQTVLQVKPKNRNAIMAFLIKSDDGNVLSNYSEKFDNYISVKNTKNKDEAEKEAGEIFKDALYVFFLEYGKRELKIQELCKQYEDIRNCYIVYSSKKKLEDNFGKRFRQEFTQLYL